MIKNFSDFLGSLLLRPLSLLATLTSVFVEMVMAVGFIVFLIGYSMGPNADWSIVLTVFITISLVIWFIFCIRIYFKLKKRDGGFDSFFGMKFSEKLKFLKEPV